MKMNNSNKLSDTAIHSLLLEFPDWVIENREGILQLEKSFCFDDFVSAMAFSNKIAIIAERYNHHPSILTEWGKVTVTWWSHSVGGLQKVDFAMSGRTDALYQAITV
jgi:4a-hydroxytetrahydrobiopterin dehydratase